ncbi:MAG TPA: hypothetical protein DDW85_09570 [Porphyromonadaceae bacterium]|nr:hypothetical protein [Porphyromonadaceae bacterium]
MKNFRFYFIAFFIATVSVCCFSCSKEDTPTPDPDPLETNHFDIWVTVGGSGGMGSNDALVVKAMKSLEGENDSIDFEGVGVDVTAKYKQETIIKGRYYYQVPESSDRFIKFQIGSKTGNTINEIPFKINTYKARFYTHAWIDDNTLVIMASDGAKKKVIWTKIDAANMKIETEGTLEFPADAPKITQFSTSGIASYRASDDKILYSYLDNKDKTRFHMAFIKASDMTVEKVATEDRAEMMAGTAYGELLQSKSFFDEKEDYYIACNTVIPGAPSTIQQFGALARIKKDATDFDKMYLGYRTPSGGKGKIITAEYLTSGKALLYIMDPKYTGAPGWGATGANCYYAILDLNTDKLERLPLPHSKGNFSQRSIVLGNKAYIGVNPEKAAPLIYIYDIPTGNLTKGKPIKTGYSFERIVALMD